MSKRVSDIFHCAFLCVEPYIQREVGNIPEFEIKPAPFRWRLAWVLSWLFLGRAAGGFLRENTFYYNPFAFRESEIKKALRLLHDKEIKKAEGGEIIAHILGASIHEAIHVYQDILGRRFVSQTFWTEGLADTIELKILDKIYRDLAVSSRTKTSCSCKTLEDKLYCVVNTEAFQNSLRQYIAKFICRRIKALLDLDIAKSLSIDELYLPFDLHKDVLETVSQKLQKMTSGKTKNPRKILYDRLLTKYYVIGMRGIGRLVKEEKLFSWFKIVSTPVHDSAIYSIATEDKNKK